jgi:hypothetical protein
MNILAELEVLEQLRLALRQDAMIYQAEAKRELAKKNGVPLDTYYYIPYWHWLCVQKLTNTHPDYTS